VAPARLAWACLAAALAALVTNDWLLKPLLIGPGALRGKVSDFAGLFLVPLPLWALAAAGGRVAWRSWPGVRRLEGLVAVATAVVALAFTTIKVSSEAAAVAEALWPWPRGWGGTRLVVDPTDLVALPMLFAGFVVSRAAWRPVLPRDSRDLVAEP
jgi:hypothetical protein